ncbi:hypothetical protein R3W88_024758 [Solanum pinnatisectum]|uniref:NADH:quinone oxidoreductase/Mrp antiporter transmembrane domain-containing protein n=1 Tax=Solanum pinnatisectum TaxID=50273 RepID=A0AAV9M132_9SOLN|nr:hypothetical protein R3W88_024758 [Solanum pinnatisectum]
MAITEFLLFVLIATLGGMFLCGANDLITIFVSPECFSLCSYLLSGYTKKDVWSNETTMKYLLMGGANSSILVHGFSWLYGSSGGEIELQEIVNGLINTQMYNSPGISIALIFITVGIGFQLSPAPSHQWTPDVYEGVRSESLYDKQIHFASSLLRMLHSWFSSFRDYECNKSIRRQKDHPKMIILWLLRTNEIRWFYFSIFLTCSYKTKVENIAKISHSQPLMKDSSKNIIFMEYDSLSRCLGGEMVDTRESKSRAKERGGSSPLQGIILRMHSQ